MQRVLNIMYLKRKKKGGLKKSGILFRISKENGPIAFLQKHHSREGGGPSTRRARGGGEEGKKGKPDANWGETVGMAGRGKNKSRGRGGDERS